MGLPAARVQQALAGRGISQPCTPHGSAGQHGPVGKHPPPSRVRPSVPAPAGGPAPSPPLRLLRANRGKVPRRGAGPRRGALPRSETCKGPGAGLPPGRVGGHRRPGVLRRCRSHIHCPAPAAASSDCRDGPGVCVVASQLRIPNPPLLPGRREGWRRPHAPSRGRGAAVIPPYPVSEGGGAHAGAITCVFASVGAGGGRFPGQ